MLEEDTESLSLDDYDLCSDFEREEFEGSSFTPGGELFDVTIMTSLPTNGIILWSKLRLSNQSKFISSRCLNREEESIHSPQWTTVGVRSQGVD